MRNRILTATATMLLLFPLLSWAGVEWGEATQVVTQALKNGQLKQGAKDLINRAQEMISPSGKSAPKPEAPPPVRDQAQK
jgi:hypothetical protein